ncbi:AMP-dependent ligase [Pseudonocardia sulfidoxydans NBRC 16205]|uniref:AMP-dependent ligase n=1 Tax=Pseudonocardia sulfidoxydans NBRC 16205 TaxID=1223511 RepID=A0A511DA13_9PSEU|nr:fatty acid--CoA ligase family protein [Pseudonocardia sulfidoxydans]GEL21223.1 AMP-dependent ligase [Pseudonocardia sulfidoxydans NBRC 16205]
MNIHLLLELMAERDGTRAALGPRDGDATYDVLVAGSLRIATAIRRSGARSVAFVGLNGPPVPQLLFGSAAAGVPFVPLNYRLPGEVLAGLLGRLDRPLVIADEGCAPALAPHVDVVHREAVWIAGAIGDNEPTEVAAAPDGPAVVLFTSGTTARPKAVELGHDNLTSYVLGTVDLASASPDDATLVAVPPYHVAGVGATLSNVYSGRRLVYLPDFDPQAWIDAVQRERVSHAMVVPTMLARIVEATGGVPPRVPTLRTLAYGGAPTAMPVLDQALALFPDVGFTNAYGLTETSATIAVLGPDDHRASRAGGRPDKLGSVGRPVPGVDVQIRDDDGAETPAGEIGQLWVRGAQVSARYTDGGSALDADGWFATRDRAFVDDDGYLFLGGRVDDVIIRGGENIHPSEIEEVLVRHPLVRDVSVVGIPDEEWGQRIAAVVVRADAGASAEQSELDADAVRAFVRDRLRGSRTPDLVVFRADLPYGPTGKLARRDVAALVTEPDPPTPRGSAQKQSGTVTEVAR